MLNTYKNTGSGLVGIGGSPFIPSKNRGGSMG